MVFDLGIAGDSPSEMIPDNWGLEFSYVQIPTLPMFVVVGVNIDRW